MVSTLSVLAVVLAFPKVILTEYFSPRASCGTKRVGHPWSNDQT